MSYVKEIFEQAQIDAKKHTLEKMGEDVMIFPCGFAWVELECKKSDQLGKEFEKEGIMSWDPYKKSYYFWVGDYNQSMMHKEAHAEKLAEILSADLFREFKMNSRMD